MVVDRIAKALSGLLLFMGVLHFVAPKPFDAIIPKEIPADPRTLTYASGVAELGIGAALLPRRTRRPAAALATALFVAVFPANINTVRLWVDKGPLLKTIAWARLPLQIPLIAGALIVWRKSPCPSHSDENAA
ncbi:DoxX family protein [Gordonia sp. (in: high G+C Gram-positive bacteria)]|uniref:DoxX family protein n=1 Tax=unclassified Gordonia (in: high G+C Gram-positive bacteria) TaxID=2657482 RepID=UPI00263088F0|nr:DoxX-like family protein [Gordonia sp. (in: high G+C Gram-positive bacteria)]